MSVNYVPFLRRTSMVSCMRCYIVNWQATLSLASETDISNDEELTEAASEATTASSSSFAVTPEGTGAVSLGACWGAFPRFSSCSTTKKDKRGEDGESPEAEGGAGISEAEGGAGISRAEGSTRVPKIVVAHDFGRTVLTLDDPVFDLLNFGDRTGVLEFLSWCRCRSILCDAVWNGSSWIVLKLRECGDENRSSEKILEDSLHSTGTVVKDGAECNGIITSIPFYDLAIATVEECNVFVPIESLVTDVVIGHRISPVDMFVSKGNSVHIKIKHVYEKIGSAEECWRNGNPAGERIKTESYNSKWGSSHKFGQGILIRKCSDLYVLLKGCFMPFRRDKITRSDGKPVTDDELDGTLNNPITCIYQPEEVITAWIGKFKPWDLIQSKLLAPRGMVSKMLDNYIAIVEECPLPGYVLCRMGVVPILLVTEHDVDLAPNYTTGDIVALCITEVKEFRDGCVLLARPLDLEKNLGLLINFTGRIIDLPISEKGEERVGTIQIDEQCNDVNFDWCSVKPFTTRVSDIWSYFERVREILKVGTIVQFTARAYSEPLRPPFCVELFVDAET